MKHLKTEPHGRHIQMTGPDRWQISYADLLTLLLGFFIVMYSVQSMESDRRQDIITALEETFTGSTSDTQSTSNNPYSLSTSLSTALGDDQLIPFFDNSQFTAEAQGDWLYLEAASETFFESGKASLTSQAKEELRRLSTWLMNADSAIEIEGHTDNVPISTSQFANNWALSSARAVSIVSYLATQGVGGHRLRAVGLGEYMPIADNQTAEGRKRNRRVVIKVERVELPLPMNRLSPLTAEPFDVLQGEPHQSDNLTGTSSENSVLESLKEKGLDPERKPGGGLIFRRDP